MLHSTKKFTALIAAVLLLCLALLPGSVPEHRAGYGYGNASSATPPR